MIIDGISIKGIFTYRVGIAVEPDDFLMHDGDLYKVISPKYDGSIPPSESIFCELYAKQVVSDLMTSKDAERILNEYIKGISIGGSISTVSITSLLDLDEYKTTAVYLVNLADSSQLLRIYNTSNGVVQELIDYELPAFQYRVFTGSEWSQWKVLLKTENATTTSYLNQLLSQSKLLHDKLAAMENLLTCMYCAEIKKEDGLYWIPSNEYLIHLIVKYTLDNQTYQSSMIIDVTAVNNDGAAIIPARAAGDHDITIQASYARSNDSMRGYSFTSNNSTLSILRALAIKKY